MQPSRAQTLINKRRCYRVSKPDQCRFPGQSGVSVQSSHDGALGEWPARDMGLSHDISGPYGAAKLCCRGVVAAFSAIRAPAPCRRRPGDAQVADADRAWQGDHAAVAMPRSALKPKGDRP